MKLKFEVVPPPSRTPITMRRDGLNKRQLRDRAANLLGSAKTSGRLSVKPCCVCRADKAHAHHENYELPHLITWLCAKHHAQRHAEARRGVTVRIPVRAVASAAAALNLATTRVAPGSGAARRRKPSKKAA